MPLFYLIAGEASGDALGAGLMRALKTENPAVTFAGIGGEVMQREGLNSLFPYSDLSIMGFWEIVPHIPKLLKRLHETVQDIAAKKPDAVVTIDSPGFNFRIAKMLKNHPQIQSIPRIHYVAPSVWAYKPGRAAKTAMLFNQLLALLPFEPPYFEKVGLKTTFVGHPVLWEPQKGDAAAFRVRHNLTSEEPLLLILPGSRMGEVRRHLPLFIAAARAMEGFRIAVLAGPQVKEVIRSSTAGDILVCDVAEKQDAFAAATLALSKSGTVTLELAAASVPTVVAHKVNALTAGLLRVMILVRYVSLVNIISGAEVVPELLQKDCNVENISQALHALAEPEEMQKQKEGLAKAIQRLRGNNEENPSVIAARTILKV